MADISSESISNSIVQKRSLKCPAPEIVEGQLAEGQLRTREDYVSAAVAARAAGHYMTSVKHFRKSMKVAPTTAGSKPPQELSGIQALCCEVVGKSLKQIVLADAEKLVLAMKSNDKMKVEIRRHEQRQRVCQPIAPHQAAAYLVEKYLLCAEHQRDKTPQQIRFRIQKTAYVAEAIHLSKYGLPLFTERPVARVNGPAYHEAAHTLKVLCPDRVAHQPSDSLASASVEISTVTSALSSSQPHTSAAEPEALTPCSSPPCSSPPCSPPPRAASAAASTIHSEQLPAHIIRILDAVHHALLKMTTKELIDEVHKETPWMICADGTTMNGMAFYYTRERANTHPLLQPIIAKVQCMRKHTDREDLSRTVSTEISCS